MDPGCGSAGSEALQGAAQLAQGFGTAAALDGSTGSGSPGESLDPGTGATDNMPDVPWLARLGTRGGGCSGSGTETGEPLGLGLDLGSGTCTVAVPPEDEDLDGAGANSGDSSPDDVAESSPGTAAASGSGGTASADVLDATPPGLLDPDDAVASTGSAGEWFQQERDRDRDGDSVRDCGDGDGGNRGWLRGADGAAPMARDHERGRR